MDFLDNSLGTFVVQTMLHSVVALVLSEAALVIWNLEGHHVRFRYRAATIILPVFLYPVFSLLSPYRSSFYFALDQALFVSRNWFALNLPGPVSVGWLALALTGGGTAAVFCVQELLPLVRNAIKTRGDGYPPLAPVDAAIETLVRDMAGELGIEPPPIRILEEPMPMVFTTGTREHSIVVSTGLLRTLSRQQLLATLAHEMAHIRRRSNAMTFLIFMVRLVTFYNPVSLLMFRRLVQDDEHVCDDITVRLSGSATALAATLRMFLQRVPEEAAGMAEMKQVIMDHSHNLLLMERIARLEAMDRLTDESFDWTAFLTVQLTIVTLCYFVL